MTKLNSYLFKGLMSPFKSCFGVSQIITVFKITILFRMSIFFCSQVLALAAYYKRLPWMQVTSYVMV